MKILALELSSGRGSVAWVDGKTEFARDWPNDRKNSAEFFRVLAEVQKTHGLPEKIVVGLGPGSYAGTRIAISAAIGVSVAAAGKVAILGYPSICALDSKEKRYGVVGDARRQAFFFARVQDNTVAEGPELLAEKELREKLASSSDQGMPVFAFEELPQFEFVKICHPSALVLARLAGDPTRDFMEPPLEPIYLREPHITLPKAGRGAAPLADERNPR